MWFELEWSPEAEQHIAFHSISKREVTALLEARTRYSRKHAGGLMIIGQVQGRFLVVFLQRKAPGSNRFKVATCRPADASEKTLFRRRGKGVQ